MTNSSELKAWLRQWVSSNGGPAVGSIDSAQSWTELGLCSKDALMLAPDLSAAMGREIHSVWLWSYSSIDSLVEFLLRGDEPTRTETRPVSQRRKRSEVDEKLDAEIERLEREMDELAVT